MLIINLRSVKSQDFPVGSLNLELSDDQLKVSLEIGKVLMEEGILFAGIDMIGNYLTEINITSPTGAREILVQTGKNPIKTLLQSI